MIYFLLQLLIIYLINCLIWVCIVKLSFNTVEDMKKAPFIFILIMFVFCLLYIMVNNKIKRGKFFI